MQELSIRTFLADVLYVLQTNRDMQIKKDFDLKEAYDHAGELLLTLGITPKL